MSSPRTVSLGHGLVVLADSALGILVMGCARGCEACQYGGRWDCVGNYRLQAAAKETATVTVQFILNGAAQPHHGGDG